MKRVQTELLEPRRLLASIAGKVFNDLDADGVIDSGENGLSGWVVYQDANLNGVRDTSAPVTVNSADVPKPLVDNGTANSTDVVSGLTGVVADVNVTINLTHTWVGDLLISVISPTGQQTFLVNQTGGANNSGDNYTNTTFDDEAANSIESGSPPYTGTFKPVGNLGLFDGLNPNGTWTLRVEDVFPADTGNLLSWSLAISTGETFVSTDSSGNYTISGLPAGTHRIREEIQAPYQQTSPPGGFHDVTVTASDTITGRNFGDRLPPGEIRGTKWKDLDDDGVKDVGEPPLAGVTVYVDADLDGIFDAGERSAVTAADGTYAITDLAPGTHIVREVVPSGYVQTFPSAFGALGGPIVEPAPPAIEPSPAPSAPAPSPPRMVAPIWAPGTDPQVLASSKLPEDFANFTFSDSSRWSRTATNGSGLVQGQATTLTWNVVNDGTFIPAFIGGSEVGANSNLRAFLTGIYGSTAAWMAIFNQIFSTWSNLTGITYVYENADDGSAFSNIDDSSTQGTLGVRADIRIGGHFIDGNSNVLAYNFFPGVGEMVLDTGDNFYSNFAGGSNLGIRNVLAHEHGHGIGLEHVMPVDQTKLMEPFVSFAFDGPQPDDILAANRGYGDRFEKSGGNDAVAFATNIGALSNGTSNTTSVSIDDDSDTDVYRFTVSSGKRATITVAPVGSTYLSGVQNGAPPTDFNSLAQSDLALQLIAPNGTTVVATANANPAGLNEVLSNIPLGSGGQYYVKVTGAANAAQLYNLTITIADALPGSHTVSVGIGEIVNNVDFGNVPIVFNGTANNDAYHLAAINAGATLLVEETLNGGPMTTYNLAMSLVNSTGVTVTGSGGADSIQLDQLSSLPPLNIDGGIGSDTLAASNSFINATATALKNASNVTLVSYAGFEVLQLTAASGSVSADLVNVDLQLASTIDISANEHLSKLKIIGTTNVSSSIIKTNELLVETPGVLGVNSANVIVNYTGSSTLGSWNGSAYSGITGMIAAGRIKKSAVRDVGIAEASLVLGLSGAQTALWHGEVVDATSVLISPTHIGDANLSGTIDADDYFLIDSNYNKPPSTLGYSKGDFDYDGDIDGDDFFLIDDNFSPSLPASQAAASNNGAEMPASNLFSAQEIDSAYHRLADDEIL